MKEVENAIEQLKYCREKAVGKPKWNAESELGVPQRNLYIECCTLLFQALLIVAKMIVNEQPAKAARICQIAMNRAKDGKIYKQIIMHIHLIFAYITFLAEDDIGVSECLLQLGICEMKTGNANTALIKFNKVLAMSLSCQNTERICEARIQIALAQSRYMLLNYYNNV